MKFEFITEEMKDLLQYLTEEDLAKIGNEIKEAFTFLKPNQEWMDHVFLPGFSPEVAEYIYNNFEPREQDVFIMSYPKTGTNWTAEVMRQVLYQDEEENRLSKMIPKSIPMLEAAPKEKAAILDKLPLKRRVFVSHLPATLINVEKIKQANAKVVYVLRNPKDQLVSHYNFMRSIPVGEIEPIKSMLFSGWDNFFNHMIAGDFPAADKQGDWYPDHILSWYQHRDNKNVYFLYFEDMKKDLCKEVKKLSDFLNAPVKEEKAQSIAKSCSFDAMRKEVTKGSNFDAKLLAVNMRKGQVGGWKDHLTVRQSEKIDQIFKEKLKNTDIKFTYEL